MPWTFPAVSFLAFIQPFTFILPHGLRNKITNFLALLVLGNTVSKRDGQDVFCDSEPTVFNGYERDLITTAHLKTCFTFLALLNSHPLTADGAVNLGYTTVCDGPGEGSMIAQIFVPDDRKVSATALEVAQVLLEVLDYCGYDGTYTWGGWDYVANGNNGKMAAWAGLASLKNSFAG